MSALIQVKADGTYRRLPVEDTPPALDTLQELVGGQIQVIYARDIAILVDEEFLLHKRYRPNVHIDRLLALHGSRFQVSGDAVVAVSGPEDLLPLPDELADTVIYELGKVGCVEQEDPS